MTSAAPPAPPYDIEKLILAAFRTAHDRGKPDWRAMTVAVLKNRLIQLSQGAFNEERHSAGSLRELLSRFPNLVRLEDRVVELLPDVDVDVDGKDRQHERVRLRPDLWVAAIDFSSGKKYSWDRGEGRAREARPGDTLILPTLTREEMRAWRTEFVTAVGSTAALERWASEELGTRALPQPLQGSWNGFVRERIAQRLTSWFSSEKIETAVLIRDEPPTRSSASTEEQLRRFIQECVSLMTAAELSEITIPAAVALRVRLQGRAK